MPERIGLRQEDWPPQDQAAWAVAIAEGDVLDGCGPATHWAGATRATNIVHYGRWLAFVASRHSLCGSPASRVTKEAVADYYESLQGKVAPRTLLSMLVGLKVMMKAMAPEDDWRWLADICNALNRSARPSIDKNVRIVPAEDIYNAAIAQLEYLSKISRHDRLWHCRYRNALMVGLLAARPLRLTNFTNLELSRSLIKHASGWLITVGAEHVKNRRPLEFDFPTDLIPFLNIYLADVRPRMLAAFSSRLWVAWKGSALSKREVHHCLTRTTQALMGRSINPHLFRDCAATSLSLVSPAAARSAAALLGHQHFSTTERHYIRARQLAASRTVNAVLSSTESFRD